jgi:orotate phosphoribosyltransferase
MSEAGYRKTDGWQELKRIITERCFLKGRFVLSSGQVSDYYFDCRNITLHPRGSLLIADAIMDILGEIESAGTPVTAIGGPTLGADPIAATAAMRSEQLPRDPVQAFIVRKEPKKHGTNLDIENAPPEGAGVVIVEDVVTTGGAIFRALEKIEGAGLTVLGVICIVDRQAGGGEKLAASYPFYPLFVKTDFD